MNSIDQLPAPAVENRPRSASPVEPGAALDPESQAWIDQLRTEGPKGEAASKALHALLLKAARFEVDRRREEISHLPDSEGDDIAHQSADDALVEVLSKLADFSGSKFTTWASKFAIAETRTKVQRRAWQGREIPPPRAGWAAVAGDRSGALQRGVGTRVLFAALQEAIKRDLSRDQQSVLFATALNDVPVDVLAERLETTRGAIYQTMHDARRELRAALAARGLGVGELTEAADDPFQPNHNRST